MTTLLQLGVCAITARPVDRALLPIRMLEIELYQISLHEIGVLRASLA